MDILEMLEEVNDGVNWEAILDDIEARVEEYYDAIAKKLNNPEQYLREILPEYWQAVRTNDIYQWGKAGHSLPSRCNYSVGIFLIGFSSLPIVMSIAEIQPSQKIYFLHSEDTEPRCDEVTYRIEEMLVDPPDSFDPLITPVAATKLIDRVRNAERREITNPSNPVETFKQIKEIIDNVRPNTKVALDLTGGKKTMIGGGFTAGSIYALAPKCDMFYVDSLEYNASRGVPIPGTEFLSQLKNPYDVYNVQSVQQAEKLFEKHNYEAAADLWQIVYNNLNTYAEQYGLENEQDTIEKNLYMADCYSLWDAFDYVEAKESKVDNGDLWAYNTKHTYNLHALIDVLKILSEVEDQETLFAEDARIIHYAIDRYQNGIRRMDSDKFDDAIVRFTQVVEILCLYQIYRIAMNNSLTAPGHGTVSQADCLNETWSISKLIIFLFGQSWKYDDYYCIGNEDMKLNINDYGYTDAVEITALIDARNKFVHVKSNPGWEEMKKNAQNLQSLACKFLKNFSGNYCCEKGLLFDALLELHRFRSVTQER